MIWIMALIFGIHITTGEDSLLCGAEIECNSEDYLYQECETSKDYIIVNATIIQKNSYSNCTYFKGSYLHYKSNEGIYGFEGNTLWVDRGCKVKFKYCYTGKDTSEVCDGKIECSSEDYLYKECEIPADYTSINVTVFERKSESNCTYYNGIYLNSGRNEGKYGFEGNKLWVDRGCQAKFNYCYTDKISSTEPTEQTVTTNWRQRFETTTSNSPGNGNEAQKQDEWIKDLSNGTVIGGVSVVIVLIMAIAIVILFLRKKRYGKPRIFHKNSMPTTGEISKKWIKYNTNKIVNNQIPKQMFNDQKKEMPSLIVVANDTGEGQGRYVSYHQLSRSGTSAVTVKQDNFTGEESLKEKQIVAPTPPPMPNYNQSINYYDDYLVPVTKRQKFNPEDDLSVKLTRTTENNYQKYQDHIYATID